MASDRRVARDLMTPNFVEVATDQPLRDCLDLLVDLQEQEESPNAVVVVDREGNYEGILSAKLLFRSLFALWRPSRSVREDSIRLEKELLEVVIDRTQMHVHDALIRGLPVAAPDERWIDLVEKVCDSQLEYLTVVEDGKAIGLVPATEVFFTAARLVLTPDDEGIRLEP